MAQVAPNSYKDPYWTNLASITNQKLGLPDGLLPAIISNGEKSNADQVSEAGAKTPFQITPGTRKAAIDKFGIDPYLSPRNAAEVAGLLLKDSLDRNHGDVHIAVAEYHGGTDRANWGPKTRAYVSRVTGADIPAPAGDAPQSTFQRVLAEQQPAGQSEIAAIYDAYKAGRMTPQEAGEFEADVKSGAVMLPKGAALADAKPAGPELLPQSVTEAYVSGKMSPQERADLEADMSAGLVKLPPTKVSQIPTDAPGWKAPTEQGILPPEAPAPTIGERAVGAAETTAAMISGGTTGMAATVGNEVSGIAQSMLNGTYGTQQAADLVEQAAAKGAQDWTYSPRTEAGQDMTQAAANAISQVVPVMPMAAGFSSLGAGMRTAAPAVEQVARGGADMAGQVLNAAKPTVMAAVNAVKSVPGAIANAAEAVGLKSPAEAAAAPAAGASVGAAAVPLDAARVAKAENLPVPIDLTTGAASRDAMQLGFEKEAMKGPQGAPLRARAEQNNLQALQNFDKIIDSTDAQAADLIGAGDKTVTALTQGYKAAKAETRAAYTKARNSPEAKAIVDPSQEVTIGAGDMETKGSPIAYLNDKPSGLQNTALTDYAKKSAVKLGIAEADDAGNLIPKQATVAQMEEWRSQLSGATNGLDAPGIRDATILKKMIDAQTEPVAGPLYKAARTLRETQARKYENRAIVANLIKNKSGMEDPKVAVDQVFRRTVLNGSPEELTFIKRVLQTGGPEGQQAWKELQGATVRHIRDIAADGLDANDKPIISPHKLNQAVKALDQNNRLDVVLGKQRAQTIRDINDVVRYVSTTPPGTLINNSGTAQVLLMLMESGGMAAATGIPLPLISSLRFLRQHIQNNKIRAKINRALNIQGKATK